MPPRRPERIVVVRGFVPTAHRLPGIEGSIIDGLNYWYRGNGLTESALGLAVTGGSSGGVPTLMNVGSGHGGTSGDGTVIQFSNAYWYINGTPFVNGAAIAASTGLSLGVSIGGGVAAGLTRPSAPVLSDSGVASSKNNGTYSVALTAVRTSTGAESSRSDPSNVVAVTNRKLRIAFPAAPSGATHWGIYCSRRGFGATGPWFHLTDIAVGPATADIEFFDGELGDIAPIDYDPPPTGTHCCAVDNVMVVVGSFGGYGLSPSVPGKPEAFPPQFTSFLPRGESVTGCKGSGPDGGILIVSANSTNELVRGGATVPILPIPHWPSTGFATGSAFCLIENELWGMSGQRGAVHGRLGSEEIDTAFATDVETFFAANGFTSANTVVAFDPKNNAVWFMSGTLGVPYMRGTGQWSTPMQVPSATTAVTVGGQMLLASGSTLYTPETGSGTSWHFTPAWHDAGSPELAKTLVRARSASSANFTADILVNLGGSVKTLSMTAPHSIWEKLNLHDVKSFTVKASGTGGGQRVDEFAFQLVDRIATAA